MCVHVNSSMYLDVYVHLYVCSYPTHPAVFVYALVRMRVQMSMHICLYVDMDFSIASTSCSYATYPFVFVDLNMCGRG